jgi:sulfide:quinone oxidoreductase
MRVRSPWRTTRPRVLIAGGGVAGLETLLALRALAGDRVDITLLAPEAKFVNRSMAVDEPSAIRSPRALRLRETAAAFDATWHRGSLERVEPERRMVITRHGTQLPYDRLVLALGARSEREWRSEGVLTYHDAHDAEDYRRLLRQLEDGRIGAVAFVKPAGPSWLLALYELALAAASEARRAQVQLSFVTPEAVPLESFGAAASTATARALGEAGIRVYTGSTGVPSRPGRLHLSPGDRRIHADRIVTLPRLIGPKLPGVPCDDAGFIQTDAHGRVIGMEDVFAAGDATAYPIKQGGLAAQQADAVARSIASSVDAMVAPRPLRPVLRGVLTADGTWHYMRAPFATGARADCSISEQPLWWPPNRLCGRYLAPYLSARVGGSAVMFGDPHAARTVVDDRPWPFAELTDL